MIALQRFSERACGPAFVLSGAIGVVLSVLHPDQFKLGALADPLWVPVHALGALDTLPQLIGWLGVLSLVGNRLGGPLRIALMTVLIGVVVGGADQLVETFLPFQVTTAQQTAADVRNAVDPGYPLIALVALLSAIALATISLALFRMGIPPRSAWLVLLLLSAPGQTFTLVVLAAFPDITWAAITLLGVTSSAVGIWIGVGLSRASRPIVASGPAEAV